jgi:hypothetical protein
MRLKCKYQYSTTEIIRELEENEKPILGEFESIDENYLYRTVTSFDNGVLVDIRDKVHDGELYYVGVVIASDGHIYIINLGDIIVEI